MVYLIRVGQKTRKQCFMKLFEKVVSVPEKYTYSDVRRYFNGMYEGFEVEIKKVDEVDISGDLDKMPPPPPRDDGEDEYKNTSHIKDFVVKLTEKEEGLHKEYRKAKSEMDSALSSLRNLIEERFKKLPYSNISEYNRRLFELEINYSNVLCVCFPVRGELFIEAAKNGENIPCVDPNPAEPSPVDNNNPNSGPV